MKPFFLAFAWCFLLPCVFCTLYCQINIENIGALSGQIANASVTQQNVWSVNNNPSTLVFAENQSAFGLNVQQHGLITELNCYNFNYYNQFKSNHVIGLNFSTRGNSDLNISSLGLCYAIKLNNYTSIGSKINLLRFQYGDIYGINHLLFADLGIYHSLNSEWEFGFSIKNITQQSLSSNIQESINGFIEVGSNYMPNAYQSFIFNISLSLYSSINYKFAYHHQLFKNFSLGLGYQTLFNQFSWGFSLYSSLLNFGFSSNFQPLFGFNNQIDLIYEF